MIPKKKQIWEYQSENLAKVFWHANWTISCQFLLKWKFIFANGYLQVPAAKFINEYFSWSRNSHSSCKVFFFFFFSIWIKQITENKTETINFIYNLLSPIFINWIENVSVQFLSEYQGNDG